MHTSLGQETSHGTETAHSATRQGRTDSPAFILLLLGALYFAQGLPLGLIFGSYPVLLRAAGVELSLLAWVPLLGLPWMLKFLWSPLVDSLWWPALGRRRTWLLLQQLLVLVAIGALILTGADSSGATSSLILLGLASLFAATQDIATDGLAAERLEGRHLALANAYSVGGMAAGVLLGGGGVLMTVDAIGLRGCLLGIVGLLVLCAIPAVVWRETESAAPAPRKRATLLAAVKRPHFLFVLIVATLYAASHSGDGSLLRLYLVDKGWAPSEIGAIDTLSMGAMIVLGCGAAAWLVARFGTWPSLLIGLVLLMASSAGWLALSWTNTRPDLVTAAALRIVGSTGMGLASVAVYTVLMLFARRGDQAGTDVTIFKSANVLGEIMAASLATALAAQIGYAAGFALTIAVSTVVLALAVLRPSTPSLELDAKEETGSRA